MTHLIHLNDNNLLVQKGSELSRAQGYAWLKGSEVFFDSDDTYSPVKHCRLAPQEINSRFWLQCDQSSVASNAAGMRHAADLIWRHLGELKQQHALQNIVLVAPSHYQQDNLRLLLGVAKSAGVAVTGLVNKAVLALQGLVHDDGEFTHLDIQLHQTVSSNLLVQDGRVTLGDVEIIQDVGIHAMQEALLKGLQQSFIQNDRFDPLHDAGTEQQLFDQLPGLMGQINESAKAVVSVLHQGRSHSTSIDAKAWNDFLAPFIKRILSVSTQAGARHTYIDLNAVFDSWSPQALDDQSLTVIDTVSQVPAQLLEQRDDEAVVYITELPALKAVQPAQAEPVRPVPLAATFESTSISDATHLLHAGKAFEFANARITVDANMLGLARGESNLEQMLTSGQLYVMNDEGRRELRINDRLGSQLADGVITVIQVL